MHRNLCINDKEDSERCCMWWHWYFISAKSYNTARSHHIVDICDYDVIKWKMHKAGQHAKLLEKILFEAITQQQNTYSLSKSFTGAIQFPPLILFLPCFILCWSLQVHCQHSQLVAMYLSETPAMTMHDSPQMDIVVCGFTTGNFTRNTTYYQACRLLHFLDRGSKYMKVAHLFTKYKDEET